MSGVLHNLYEFVYHVPVGRVECWTSASFPEHVDSVEQYV